MDTLIFILVGFYLFFESLTAVNEMPKIKLRYAFKELKNPYTLKYISLGLIGLVIMFSAPSLDSWVLIVVVPLIYFVFGRTKFRIIQHKESHQ